MELISKFGIFLTVKRSSKTKCCGRFLRALRLSNVNFHSKDLRLYSSIGVQFTSSTRIELPWERSHGCQGNMNTTLNEEYFLPDKD